MVANLIKINNKNERKSLKTNILVKILIFCHLKFNKII